MVARQIAAALATVGFIIAILLFLFVLGLLLPILLFLGLALFLLIMGVIVVFAVLTVVLIPFYYLTKRPRVEPGSYRLEDVEEK